MAYNLRTGLTGSGDIDVNVSLSGLTADNIQSGTFGSARIPTLSNSKISDLDAAKLTGTIASGRLNLQESDIPTLPKTHIETDNTWQVSEIPSIPSDKITSLVATKLTGEIDDARIPNLSATKITSGTFASADRIPTLPSSKIDPATTFAKSMINTAEEWPLADIPDLPATKITSGSLDVARIPDLSATKITSDTLNAARIPNLDAAKITTGTISSARLPATTSDCLMLRGLLAAYGASAHTKTITTTYAALASQTNGSFTAPASGMVVVTLTFYLVCAHDKAVLARLVKGGTTTEFTSAYSLNSSGITCQETDNVYVVKHTTADSADTFDKQVQVTWLLTGLSSGSTYAVDAHVKTGAGTATCNWGDYGSVNHPPILFEVRNIPNSVASVVISEGSGG